MIERDPSDNEIIARMEKSTRAEWRLVRTAFLLFAVLAAILFGGTWLHLPMALLGGVAFVLLLAWVLSVFRSRDYLPVPPEAYFDESILHKTIDIQQRRWRWIYVLYFGLVVQQTWGLTHTILRTSRADLMAGSEKTFGLAVIAGALAFIALMSALMVCFGPTFLNGPQRRALRDELTRSQQHRAAMFGYILSVIAMCAVLTAQLYHPPWGLAALPGAIAAVVILPGIYFLILQWRAGHDG